jgi:hypothetical protein
MWRIRGELGVLLPLVPTMTFCLSGCVLSGSRRPLKERLSVVNHIHWHALPWEREARLQLAEGSTDSLDVSLLTAPARPFLPELHLHLDPSVATSRILDLREFS